MNISALEHITYSAAGGFTAGALGAVALMSAYAPRVAGRAYSYFPYAGAALAITAAVARAVDEVFKALGWTEDAGIRLIFSHIIVGLALLPVTSFIVGTPEAASRACAVALTIASLAVNVIIK